MSVFALVAFRRRRSRLANRLPWFVRNWVESAADTARRVCMAFLVTTALGTTIMIGAGGLYAAKSSLRIDVVPGIDMLPDKEIASLLSL